MAWAQPTTTRASRRAKLKGGWSKDKFNAAGSGLQGRYIARHGSAPKGAGAMKAPVLGGSGDATKTQYSGWSKELQAAYKRRHGKAPTK